MNGSIQKIKPRNKIKTKTKMGLSESGRMAEEYLGGKTTLPALDPKIVDQLISDGNLVNVDELKFTHDPEYASKIGDLYKVVRTLVEISSRLPSCRDEGSLKALYDQMFAIKKGFRDKKLLREALLRYAIKAQPADYDPTEPGSLNLDLPTKHRNNYMYHLHSDVCRKLGVNDPELVRFYNAVGSPIDTLYGTDGFFIIEGEVFPDNERRVLYVDATKNERKVEESGGRYYDGGEPIFRFDSLLLRFAEVDDVHELRGDMSEQIRRAVQRQRPDDLLDGFVYN